MERSLTAFASANGDFFRGGSQPLKDLAQKLKIGVASDQLEFTWGTREKGTEKPICSLPSTTWKGHGDHDPVLLCFSMNWTCLRDQRDGGILHVKEGVTAISFLDGLKEPPSKLKLVHFDICEGGNTAGSGHPSFHTQFHGDMNDIPRLPTFLVHPVDTLEWALMDCFQERWRRHLSSISTKSQLRGHGKVQHGRLQCFLQHWSRLIDCQQDQPLLALQNRMGQPLVM